jgi:hypothetical protein
MNSLYGNLSAWFYDIDKPLPPEDELNNKGNMRNAAP